jgi:hypothetical protein
VPGREFDVRILWRSAALRGPTIAAACSILFFTGTAANAGPCTAQIGRLDRQLRLAGSDPIVGPTAPQTVDAQLHHQPTPSAVQHAKIEANAEADAALERARKADAQGDARACREALGEARRLYGF